MVERLPSKLKALGSVLSSGKKNSVSFHEKNTPPLRSGYFLEIL